MLLGFLDFLRATIKWKTDGLSDDQLHAKPMPSSMSLGGLLQHLAYVEDFWFGCVLNGEAPSDPWDTIDWKQTPDWEWDTALSTSGDALRDSWDRSIESSRGHWVRLSTLAGFELGDPAVLPGSSESVSVRWVLTHMVEEYGRHCGHADLLREAIDGATGE